MYSYYIKGKTYLYRLEIVKLKPRRKNFVNKWYWNKKTKEWLLHVPNNYHSQKFQNEVTLFCNKRDLELEVIEFTRVLTKSINDFDSIEAFFDYFHSLNNKNVK